MSIDKSKNYNNKVDKILVVDDDKYFRDPIKMLLNIEGYDVVTAGDMNTAIEKLFNNEFDAIITDLRLPDGSGLKIVKTLKDRCLDIPSIIMTGFSSVSTAVEALRIGAVDYIIKPFKNEELLYSLKRALNEKRLERENKSLKQKIKKLYSIEDIIGNSNSIKELKNIILRIAPTEASVIIQGESGTGKELVAQAIHLASSRSENPFIAVNCGAIPTELMEAEFFGHLRGAYTGAIDSKEGYLREAHHGTLFLDEITELDPQMQVKLLRVIQEKEVRPIGGKRTYAIDTRFIAATNKDLKQAVKDTELRSDLFYRLNVINIYLAPLRDRDNDIKILVKHFIKFYNQSIGRKINEIEDEAINLLSAYHWPGNVRELQNVIERAMILSDSDKLSKNDFRDVFSQVAVSTKIRSEIANEPLSIDEYTKYIVKRYQDKLKDIELAELLGIGRKALWARRRRWGLFRVNENNSDAA